MRGGIPKIWEPVNQEECDGVVNIIVLRELIDVVVIPASRQPGRPMVEGIEIGWVERHRGE